MPINNENLNSAIRDTLVIILAGGRGTRLGGLTKYESKPAVPFGGEFRLIDFPLSNCINSGFRRIALASQYQAQTLMHHVNNGWNLLNKSLNEFIEMLPAEQKHKGSQWYCGTADAIAQNIRYIKSHRPKYVMILSGDHIYKQDFSIMLRDHIDSDATCTVSCLEVPKADASAFGCIDVDDTDMVINFIEKPENPPTIPGNSEMTFASQGNYIFDADTLLEILEADTLNEESSHDFGHDILPLLVQENSLLAHSFSKSCVYSGSQVAYWKDVGTIDAYWKANIALTDVIPDFNFYDDNWNIFSKQEFSLPAKFVFDDNRRRGQAMDSLISSKVIISGALVKKSVISHGVGIHSGSVVEKSVILPNAVIQPNCTIINAVIGEDCVIPENTDIGVDNAEDKRFFEVTDEGIVLVTQSTLKKYRTAIAKKKELELKEPVVLHAV